MSAIEVFADVVCPFTHVGLRYLFDARRRHGSARAIRVRAWPLELINGAPLDPAVVTHEIDGLKHVAPDAFGGFDPAQFPATSIPAFGLAAAAYAIGDDAGERASLALRDALFEHGADIGDVEVVARIGRELGVPMLDRADAEIAVRADWELGRARGVRGSPHFFSDGGDWFCPGLHITKLGEEFEISRVPRTREFYDVLFA
jgi:predicted DsbA family dithiol-disulfide isomerase